ncbi:hypothetical protein Slin15195_G091770 [Septoria linicola]|uniref:Uncharacterized protein n=1 Tax=Septoria linicola TaxID=215465 RepID=A0A9Q9B1I1_9PEZI|nr:hypothetical protein Slin15195_G091770 [Septoria linicola]
MFLDTHLGVIYFPGSPSAAPQILNCSFNHLFAPVQDDPYSYAPASEAVWRGAGGAGHCCWAIEDFFELLKFRFFELEYIPLSRQIVEERRGMDSDEDDVVVAEKVREIYGEYGWPDLEAFRKEECLSAVERWVEESYPDRFFAY